MQRGELDFAITLAAELAEDRKHLPLDTALRFLPLVAGERPGRVRPLGAQMAGPLDQRGAGEPAMLGPIFAAACQCRPLYA